MAAQIVICSVSITVIINGSDGNNGKTLTRWDLTFAAQSQ
jgi:hypothetical protein